MTEDIIIPCNKKNKSLLLILL